MRQAQIVKIAPLSGANDNTSVRMTAEESKYQHIKISKYQSIKVSKCQNLQPRYFPPHASQPGRTSGSRGVGSDSDVLL